MKKLIVFFACIMAALTGSQAYTQDFQTAFKPLSAMKGVETVYIGPAMMKMASQFDADVEGIKITKSITSIGVYSIENSKSLKAADNAVSLFVKDSNLEPMMTSSEEDEQVSIWSQSNQAGNISLIVIYVREPEEGNLICITGDISMDEIGSLINQAGVDAPVDKHTPKAVDKPADKPAGQPTSSEILN